MKGYSKLVPNIGQATKIGPSTYRSENCTPRKLRALYKMNNEATWLALNRDTSKPKSNNKCETKPYSHLGFKHLQKTGKRTANVSVNVSSSSVTSNSNDLKKLKNNKKSNLVASAILSPNKNVNHIENDNKKMLWDYQKDK